MTFSKDTNLNNWNNYIGINNGNHMFSSMTENRKRSREDDVCEFMPLSKRINNLHINNRELNNGSNTERPSTSQENGISSSQCTTNSAPRRPMYDPGLSSSQSNYYYENKLLFQLHLERIQRSGQQFPF